MAAGIVLGPKERQRERKGEKKGDVSTSYERRGK